MPEQVQSSDRCYAKRIPISVLILTLNEQANIGSCIASVNWSDDIVVLDSFSTDGTQALARQCGARVYERAFDNFADQRNFALETIHFKHEWILHLDADEVVTEHLREEMALSIRGTLFKAFKIPSKLMFQGKWLRFSGMYPSYQVRFGRADSLRFEQIGHGQRETLDGDAIGTLRSPYLHFSFSKGMADWIERHNRYSTDEALQDLAMAAQDHPGWLELIRMSDPTLRRRALKAKAAKLPFRPLLRFLYMYVIRLGFLDGRVGFTYCRLLSMYEYWTVLKIREFRRTSEPPV